MALCVSLCPTEELKTYQDLRRFAMINGELITHSWVTAVRPVEEQRDGLQSVEDDGKV